MSQERPKMKRVLVVDDEPCIADSLSAILRHCGYQASAVYDAASALVLCQSCPPDLVISDVAMPRMNGIQMAIYIRQHYPNCKILLFSGTATTTDLLEDARRQGYSFELLAKPVHPSDLLAKLAA